MLSLLLTIYTVKCVRFQTFGVCTFHETRCADRLVRPNWCCLLAQSSTEQTAPPEARLFFSQWVADFPLNRFLPQLFSPTDKLLLTSTVYFMSYLCCCILCYYSQQNIATYKITLEKGERRSCPELYGAAPLGYYSHLLNGSCVQLACGESSVAIFLKKLSWAFVFFVDVYRTICIAFIFYVWFLTLSSVGKQRFSLDEGIFFYSSLFTIAVARKHNSTEKIEQPFPCYRR